METLGLDSTKCPFCAANLVGDPIPASWQESHGGATHYRTTIMIYDSDFDRTVDFQCPNCLMTNTMWRQMNQTVATPPKPCPIGA